MGEMADAQYDEFCWALSDPDFNEGWYGRRRDPTKWSCKDGTVMNIADMTDSHVANAIAYCENLRNFYAVELLTKEKKRREDAKFFGIKMECPFCQSTMKRQAYEPNPEDCTGFCGWTKYAFTCNDCGARGPLHDKHEPKTIQRRTTQRNSKSLR